MSLHIVAVYHNTESRFFEYEDGQQLRQVISHWRQWPTGTDPLQIADWAWHVFNLDLDALESDRGMPEGEADFLIAAAYRLMRHRSLSVGDVVSVTTEDIVTWLACDNNGWRQITAPAAPTGAPLSAEAVHRHARGGDGDQ